MLKKLFIRLLFSKIVVNVKLLSGDAKMPKFATDGSAACDAYAPRDFVVKPGRSVMPLDIAIAMPKYIKMNVRARSGFSVNGMEGKFVISDRNRTNADVILGLVDSDYRKSVGVIIYSKEKNNFTIPAGARICQLEFGFVPNIELTQVNELDTTNRDGGFGSTGTK